MASSKWDLKVSPFYKLPKKLFVFCYKTGISTVRLTFSSFRFEKGDFLRDLMKNSLRHNEGKLERKVEEGKKSILWSELNPRPPVVNVIKLFSVGNLDVGIYPKILKVF